MYLKILLNKRLSFRKRLKKLADYFTKKMIANIGWRNRFKKVYAENPSFNKILTKEVKKNHIAYWSVFRWKVNLSTLKVSSNSSGIYDYRYIPEEIFYADIEPSLNSKISIQYFANKSFYNHWFVKDIFPQDYFHNIDGEYLDENLRTISFENIKELAKNLTYPVVFKPNQDSSGGKGVYFIKDTESLISCALKKKNFVVQEKLRNHHFFEKFNALGLNTLRVCLYRSISDNKIKFLHAALRMGVGGSLDNETDGGIVSYIDENGRLNGFARNKFGKKFLKHPDSNMEFTDYIPCYNDMILLATEIAHRIFYAKIISLDMCYDHLGKWRVIEINLNDQTIRFSQYAGQPFFGEYTDEVLEYCKINHWALTN